MITTAAFTDEEEGPSSRHRQRAGCARSCLTSNADRRNMKEEAQPLPSARWSWSAILLFLVACATGPAVTWWAQPHSGDESMAAAIDGVTASGVVFALGLPFAVAALLKERRHRILSRITGVLYAVPLLGLLCLLLVYLANR